MKLEQSISPSQLFYLLAAFLLGSSAILFPGSMAENNAWLAAFLGMMEGFLFLAIYLWLAAQHPGKNLIEINDLVFGSYLGKALSVLYLFFFLFVTAELLRTFAEFFGIIMTSTPLLVFMITLMLVSYLPVRGGLEVFARYSQIVVIFVVVIFIFDFFMLLMDFKLSNLLPFMDIPINKMLLAVQGTAALPFGETVVFLMFINFISNTNEAGRAMKKAFLFYGLLSLLYAVRTIAVLGSLAYEATYPGFTALRMINVGEIFTRLEILIAVVFLSLGFVKGNLFYYGTVLGFAQLLKMRSYYPLIIPVGILVLNISLLLYDEYIYDLLDVNMLFPIYSMVFAFFLPLLTLMIAKIRKTSFAKEDALDA